MSNRRAKDWNSINKFDGLGDWRWGLSRVGRFLEKNSCEVCAQIWKSSFTNLSKKELTSSNLPIRIQLVRPPNPTLTYIFTSGLGVCTANTTLEEWSSIIFSQQRNMPIVSWQWKWHLWCMVFEIRFHWFHQSSPQSNCNCNWIVSLSLSLYLQYLKSL